MRCHLFLTTFLSLGVLNGLDLNFVLLLMVDLNRLISYLEKLSLADQLMQSYVAFFATTFVREVGGPINLMMISSLMTLSRGKSRIRPQFWYCVNIVSFPTQKVFCFEASM